MEPDDLEGDAAKNKGGLVPTVIAFVVISVVAVGAGWFMGSGFSERPAVPTGEIEVASVIVKKEKKDDKKKDAHGKSAEGDEEGEGTAHSGPTVAMLDPIVTSLGNENGLWLRLELAVIFGEGKPFEGDIDKVALQSDIVAYLRTIDADMLSGASGFIHLHEDLVDRVRMTTAGRAIDVKVLSVVAE